MSVAAEPKQPADPKQPAAASPQKPAEPVLGVTLYDRVFSFLTSMLLISSVLSAPFGAIWLSTRNWDWLSRRPPVKVEVQDVIEDVEGGGAEDGELDSSLYAPGPEGPDVSTASTDDSVISDSPAMEQTMTAVLNAVGAAIQISDTLMMGSDIGSSALPSGNPKGKGTKRNIGKGPGDGGGVKRSERWEISFPEGQSETEYAKQLDYFKVELGAIVNGQLYRISKLSSAKPEVRKVPSTQNEKQLYFSWRGGSRRQIDLNLLKKAPGVPLDGATVIVLQFYPQDTEQQLARLEKDFAVKNGKERMELVRKTRFNVIKKGAGYDFEISKQEYFGQPPSKG